MTNYTTSTQRNLAQNPSPSSSDNGQMAPLDSRERFQVQHHQGSGRRLAPVETMYAQTGRAVTIENSPNLTLQGAMNRLSQTVLTSQPQGSNAQLRGDVLILLDFLNSEMERPGWQVVNQRPTNLLTHTPPSFLDSSNLSIENSRHLTNLLRRLVSLNNIDSRHHNLSFLREIANEGVPLRERSNPHQHQGLIEHINNNRAVRWGLMQDQHLPPQLNSIVMQSAIASMFNTSRSIDSNSSPEDQARARAATHEVMAYLADARNRNSILSQNANETQENFDRRRSERQREVLQEIIRVSSACNDSAVSNAAQNLLRGQTGTLDNLITQNFRDLTTQIRSIRERDNARLNPAFPAEIVQQINQVADRLLTNAPGPLGSPAQVYRTAHTNALQEFSGLLNQHLNRHPQSPNRERLAELQRDVARIQRELGYTPSPVSNLNPVTTTPTQGPNQQNQQIFETIRELRGSLTASLPPGRTFNDFVQQINTSGSWAADQINANRPLSSEAVQNINSLAMGYLDSLYGTPPNSSDRRIPRFWGPTSETSGYINELRRNNRSAPYSTFAPVTDPRHIAGAAQQLASIVRAIESNRQNLPANGGNELLQTIQRVQERLNRNPHPQLQRLLSNPQPMRGSFLDGIHRDSLRTDLRDLQPVLHGMGVRTSALEIAGVRRTFNAILLHPETELS